jgi:hypothetical protein
VQGRVRGQFGYEKRGRGPAVVVSGLRPTPLRDRPAVDGVARRVRGGEEQGAEVSRADDRSPGAVTVL